jgi:vitamin B12 transporter
MKKLCLVLCLLVGSCATVLSQKKITLDEVIVSTNRFEQKQSQIGKAITILDDSLLRANASKTLGDLLNQQVGITVIGGQQPLGSIQTLYMRAARTGYTLVLIDGQPANDPSVIENNFDINFIPVSQISRVEILKGGQSSLYGSDAIAGVINIVTKSPSQKAKSLSSGVNWGSYGTFQAQAGLLGSFGKTHYQIQQSVVLSKGFSSAYDAKNTAKFDNDRIKQATLRATLNHDLSPNLVFKLSTMISQYKSDLDAGAFVDDRDYTNLNRMVQVGSGLVHSSKSGKTFFNYQYSNTLRTYLDDSVDVPANAFSHFISSEYAAQTQFLELYTTQKLSKNFSVVAGADFRSHNTDQSYLSFSSFGKYEAPPLKATEAKVQIMSAFASVLLQSSTGFNTELGGRINRHSTYGSNATYTFNPYYLYQQRLKIFLSLSSSFKAPSLYQLYSPYGNKTLKPETAQTLDVGIQLFGKTTKDYIRGVFFSRKASDVIFFQSLSKEPYGKYINLEQQQDQGIELDGQVSIQKLRLSANYTFLTGELSTQKSGVKDTTYFNLFRRPKHAINAAIGYTVSPKMTIGANLKSVSSRMDAFFNEQTYSTENVTLEAYTTLDVSMNYRLTKNWSVSVDARNLTNTTYFEQYGFNSRKFNWNIGLIGEM